MRCIIYVRISRDREGSGLGVKRQERECRELAEGRKWSVSSVFVDDDVSAYSGKRREGYEGMLAMVRAGEADAIVAWHPDRLHRSPRGLEGFIDVLEQTGTRVATVRAGDYDLATPAGRMAARVVGAVARNESEQKSDRLRSKFDELASRGRWKGGPRPFGYRPAGGTLVVVEGEAAVVRECAGRVLAGESLYSICADLNGRAVPTAQGRAWRTPTLARILTAPSIAGLRERKGEIVGPASWPGILTDDERLRIARLLATGTRSHPPRVSFLSGGLIVCGKCGAPLHTGRRSKGARVYWCTPGPDKGGCGGVQVRADAVEEFVADAVIAAVPKLPKPKNRGRATHEQVAKVEARLDDLADLFATGDISRREWMRARAKLNDEHKALVAKLGDGTTTLPANLAAKWPSLGLDQRRAVVGAVVDRVVIAPATRRGPVFDYGRVTIDWRA